VSAVLAVGAMLVAPTPTLAQNPNLLTDMPGIEPGLPILVQADQMVYNNETDEVTATGNVQIFYEQYALVADKVVYDRIADELTATGNVRFTQPDGNVVFAKTLTVTGDFKEGFIRSASLLTPENARVVATSAERVEGNVVVFNRAVYTACEAREDTGERDPIWQIKAVRVVHNQEEKTIEYRNATFEFLGMPIAFFPYFFHPDPTVKRKSGFLVPSANFSSELGYSASLPYFWAIAPNKDLTVTPTVFTKQGLLLEGEYRHRLDNGTYTIRGAGIFQSDPNAFAAPGNREFRGAIGSSGRFQLSSDWIFGWDGTLVTDDSFLRKYDISDRSEIVSQAYLVGQSDRNYFDLRAMHFRDLARAGTTDMQPVIHPVLDHNFLFSQPVFGGQLGLDTNVTSLSRTTGADSTRVTTQLHWNRTFTDRYGQQFTPFFSVRGDVHQVNDVADPITALARPAETVTRGMAAAGFEYKYPLISLHSWGQQILEPIVQVIVRPNEQNAGHISNEDALSLVFDDTILFDRDKFSGFDRIEGGSRANVGFRYTVQTNNGGHGRFVFGQSFHLAGANPFAAGSGLDTDRSDFVGGLYLKPNSYFGVYSQFRLDQDTFAFNRNELGAWAQYSGASANVSYMRVRDESGATPIREEIQGSARIPLHSEWNAFGSWRYDIAGAQNIERSVGVGYVCDCFRASVELKETFYTNRDITPARSILFRFFFKSIGDGQFGQTISE